ncbi:Synaptic vesicular amine transporter [Hypsibius exemplaris]|uniref:Synaptic vesicular amine transporter n=1 Tax=Hypsibius exemplaris TaxID=2072580 RepID=A0A1W0XDL3_HYPEX|nr:Synaptic vesicular amine transporter [Hypsibius exemplaris]
MLGNARVRLENLSYKLQSSDRTTLVIVFLGLMLDNLLLTVVVPILPDYLYELEHSSTASGNLQEQLSIDEPDDYSEYIESTSTTQRTFIAADLLNENSRIGLLFSSKAFVQLFVNPCVGIISGRLGYSIPSFVGLVIIFFSSVVFAIGSSYGALFFARCIQGFGSSALVISGMGLISSRYPEEVDRSKNMGVALSGIAAGVLIGYPFGSIIYDAAGKALPFALIAICIALLGVIQYLGLPPQANHETIHHSTSSKTLLKDPYILAVVVTICVSTSAMAILEPCLPLWLLETMQPEQWQLGTAFVPDSIGYFIGSSFFGVFALRVGRWKCAIVAMIVLGLSAICIPFATHIYHLILPHFGLGIGIGVVDASFMPLLAYLVDLRHDALYGSVFAICQIAVCLAYSLGPLLGGLIANSAGFPFLMRMVGVTNILLSPVCLYLRHIPVDVENQALIHRRSIQSSTSGTNAKPSNGYDVGH